MPAETIVTNAQLESLVDTSAKGSKRLGIHTRELWMANGNGMARSAREALECPARTREVVLIVACTNYGGD
jgi:3-oxoacyl-[acyl-carrier-protein] synthase III